MKVKELIKILVEFDQDLEVWIPGETGRQQLTAIYDYIGNPDNHVLLDGDY